MAKRLVRALVLLAAILVWRLYRADEPEEDEEPELADYYPEYGTRI